MEKQFKTYLSNKSKHGLYRVKMIFQIFHRDRFVYTWQSAVHITTSIHVNTHVHRQLPMYSVHTQSFINSAMLSKSLKHQSKILEPAKLPGCQMIQIMNTDYIKYVIDFQIALCPQNQTKCLKLAT